MKGMYMKWLFLGLAVCLIGLAAPPVHAADPGVFPNKLVIGVSTVLTGPASRLGTELMDGSRAYINEINSQGGVHGRKIEFVECDDGYESNRSASCANKLIQSDKVFVMMNTVGTPTSTAIVPIITREKVPYLFAFTGAEFLRSPFNRYIGNVRASYWQEAEAQVFYHTEVLGKKRIAVFYQADAFGLAVLSGVEKAAKKRGMEVVSKGTFIRNTTDIEKGYKDVMAGNPDAVCMVGTYEPLALFVKKARSEGKNLPISTVSFVGSMAYMEHLGKDGNEMSIVSQVVPHPWDTKIPIVAEYHKLHKKHTPKAVIGYSGLEGFLNAKTLVEILKRAGKDVTRESFIDTMEKIRGWNPGGLTVNFSDKLHQGLHEVYISHPKNGKYTQVKILRDVKVGKGSPAVASTR